MQVIAGVEFNCQAATQGAKSRYASMFVSPSSSLPPT